MQSPHCPPPDDAALAAFADLHIGFVATLDLSEHDWIVPDHLTPVWAQGRDVVLPTSPRDYVRFLVVAAVQAPHDAWMAYVQAALDVVYVSPDGLSKVAWSLPWDDTGLDKVEMLLARGARLAQVLNMATLLDTRSNHIMVKRYGDPRLELAVPRDKSYAHYARFLARFDVAQTLDAQDKALVLLNCDWWLQEPEEYAHLIVACGVDWDMVLRQSLVKLFYAFHETEEAAPDWERGHYTFAPFIACFADDITDQLTPEGLGRIGAHLARWKPLPALHLLPLVQLGADAGQILLSLPRKDGYYRTCMRVLADGMTNDDPDRLEQTFSVRQYFDAVQNDMAPIVRKRFTNRILPDLGRHVITHLSQGKIAPLHFKLKSTPRIANLVLDDISAMVRTAQARGWSQLAEDPCAGIMRYLPDLQTLKPADLPRAYAPVPDQYDGTSDRYFHDAYYHILDPGDAVLARQPQQATGGIREGDVPRGAHGVLVRDGDQWAVDWEDRGRTSPVDAQKIFKRDLKRAEPSAAYIQAQKALPPDHYIGMQGEVFHMPNWLETVAKYNRGSGDFIQSYLEDLYSRWLFQPTYIFLKIPWISKGAKGPWRQLIKRRFAQVDWINLEQLDRIATSMQYVGLIKRRNLDDTPAAWELEQHLVFIRSTFDPSAPPIRRDLAAVIPREARTFYHLDASQRVMVGIQDNPDMFPDASLANVFRDHLHSVIFEDEIFMDYARSVDYDGSGYFMTHVCFYLQAVQDYDLFPMLFNYMEAIQIYQLEQGNVEVAGEVMTCLFSVLHKSPANSPLFASSIKYLVETAGADLSWPDRFYTHLTPYKMLHVPWTAIQDIRPPEAPAANQRNQDLQRGVLHAIPDWDRIRAMFGQADT